MGVVHRASWGGLGPAIPVAVKFITRDRSGDRDPALLREARMAARLSHPNVVTLLDVGRLGEPLSLGDETLRPNIPYLVMEWVDGPTVKEAEPTSWDELSSLLDGLLAALAHAHAWGVVHRDIKPGNVMLTSQGVVKLTDFGIGRGLQDDIETPKDRRVLGTPQYMAPEQIIGSWRDEGPWTDLYGVGILAWRLATGSVPFTGARKVVLAQQLRENPHEFEPRFDVPAAFEDWVRRALQKNTHHRFRRAADARAALASTADAGRTTRRYFDTPTVPEHWPSDDHALARDLRPAGLGLFSLRRPPIVGREAEKARLWHALRRAANSASARTVVIRGSSGTGKSALAEWLARRATEGGYADVLRSFWEAEPVPGDGHEGTLERFFNIEELPPEDAVRRVRDRLVEVGLSDDSTELATMLTERMARAERTSRGLTSREEWVHVVRELLGALAAERPTVWVMDDAQWSNAAVDLVRRINGTELPVLFVITLLESVDAQRPPGFEGYLEDIVESSSTDVVDLDPLDDEAQREVVSDLLRLEPALVEDVVHRTDGSPLFAAQLVGDWVMRGRLEPGPFGYQAADDGIGDLPEDIHEMWQRRLDVALRSRAPTDRDAVNVAAVLGKEVDLAEWRAAAALADCAPDRGLLETLVVHGLATWHFGGFAFVHGMLRESVLVAAENRHDLNRAVATALFESGHRDGRTLERCARHMSRAGDDRAAFKHLAEAIEQYYQAEDIDAVIVLGSLVDDWSRRAVARDSPDYAAALGRVAAIYRFRGDLETARQLLSRAVDIVLDGAAPDQLIERPDPRRNQLFAQITSELAIVGEETIPDSAVTLRLATLAREVAGAADLALEEAWGAAMQASTLSETGRLQDALDAARFAVDRLERAGLTHGRHGMHSYFTLSEVAKLAGELDESGAALDSGLAVARAIGQRIGVAYGLSSRADHFFAIGQLDRARETAIMSRDLYRRTGSPTADYISANILLYDLEDGDFSGALAQARHLVGKWKNYGMRRRLPTLLMTVAVCHAHAGDDDEARAHFDEALASSDDSGRIVDDAVILAVMLATHTGSRTLAERARKFAQKHRNLLPIRFDERLKALGEA